MAAAALLRFAARAEQRSRMLIPASSANAHPWVRDAPAVRCPAGPVPHFVHQGAQVPDECSAAAIGRVPFMQLMAVPKRKVSPSRKGKRNGPKALKVVPVVAKCKVCGRIKLPHFYCCSGEEKVAES